jgi:hypothetical protein
MELLDAAAALVAMNVLVLCKVKANRTYFRQGSIPRLLEYFA